MIKKFNWRTDLTAHINMLRYEPYEWGKHDCCMWAASCVTVMTGTNLVPKVSYKDELGAARALKKLGVSSVLGLCEKHFGEPQHIATAKAGDLVVLDTGKQGPFKYSVGICNGMFSFFAGEEGLEMVKTLDLEGCFHV